MYSGDITEEGQENMSTFFYDLPTSNRRRNQHIYPSTSVGALKFSYLPKLFSRAGLLSPGAFVYPPRDSGSSESGETHRTAFTIYVVADLNSETGLALVKEALDSMVSTALFLQTVEILTEICTLISATSLGSPHFIRAQPCR